MANVSLQPDPQGGSTADLIGGIEDGIYVVGDKSWSIDMQRYNFQFTGQRFYRIKGGELAGQVRDVAYQATTTDFWGAMDAVGGPADLPARRCLQLRQGPTRSGRGGLARLPGRPVPRHLDPEHRRGRSCAHDCRPVTVGNRGILTPATDHRRGAGRVDRRRLRGGRAVQHRGERPVGQQHRDHQRAVPVAVLVRGVLRRRRGRDGRRVGGGGGFGPVGGRGGAGRAGGRAGRPRESGPGAGRAAADRPGRRRIRRISTRPRSRRRSTSSAACSDRWPPPSTVPGRPTGSSTGLPGTS